VGTDSQREADLRRIDAASRRMTVNAIRGRDRALQDLRWRVRVPLTAAELTVLDRLLDRPMRLTDLAASIQVSQPSITRQVQSLEKKGLIERAPDENDGRVTILSLSPRGAEAARGMNETILGMLRRILADWDDEEVNRIAPVLERFADAVEEFEAKTQPWAPLG